MEAARIPAPAAALDRAGADPGPFALKLARMGTFEGLRHPRVLWYGVESDGLFRLQAGRGRYLHEAGCMPQVREYTSCLTPGRMAGIRSAVEFRARLMNAWPGFRWFGD